MEKQLTKKETILQYLKKKGHINTVEAFNMYILRLSAIIFELKQDGWNIEAKKLIDKKTKKTQPYATYFLKKPYKLF